VAQVRDNPCRQNTAAAVAVVAVAVAAAAFVFFQTL
jgi:hypothetical protein